MATASTSRLSVLLLEDDAQLAEMIQLSLGDEFEIDRAANAEEAKGLLGARAFDVLLCDHMMPGAQQGLEFLVEAMQYQPKASRILMTGYINPDLITRSMMVAGLTACMIKPFEMSELRRQLQQCAKPGR